MRNLVRSDVHIERDWVPIRTVSKRWLSSYEGPATVSVTAVFDDHEAALDFERKVRELLEAA